MCQNCQCCERPACYLSVIVPFGLRQLDVLDQWIWRKGGGSVKKRGAGWAECVSRMTTASLA